jgi:nickel/cobalt exporter
MANSQISLILLASLVLGMRHAFEADHMAAVHAFVATKPNAKQGARFAMHWATGHGLMLLLLGVGLHFMHWTINDSSSRLLESLVGVALIVLGAFSVLRLNMHGKGSFWMGMLHGVAGSTAFLGQSAAAFYLGSPVLIAYALFFSFGILLSMSSYAGVLGFLLKWGHERSVVFLSRARILVGLSTFSVGLVTLLKNL